MSELLSNNLWTVLRKEARRSGQRLIAVAYAYAPKGLSLGPGDALITDASQRAIRSGQTNAKALVELIRSGVKVYSHPALHANGVAPVSVDS
jgi:hypothetical protein